jgi:hypothetical protein
LFSSLLSCCKWREADKGIKHHSPSATESDAQILMKESELLQARILSVENDMKPVVGFLRSKGLSDRQVVEILIKHPPTLSYSVTERLEPFFNCMSDIGMKDFCSVRYAALHNGSVMRILLL